MIKFIKMHKHSNLNFKVCILTQNRLMKVVESSISLLWEPKYCNALSEISNFSIFAAMPKQQSQPKENTRGYKSEMVNTAKQQF